MKDEMADSLVENYRDFPVDEYARRTELLRKELSRQRLDAVLLTHEPNIRWLTGYHIVLTQRIKWMVTAVLFPCEQDTGSVLLCATDATGTDMASVDEVKFWDVKTKPPFNSYTNPAKILVQEIKKRGLRDKRIGMELGGGMRVDLSQNDIAWLRHVLPDVTMVDFTSSLWHLRSIKSGLEIDKLKKSAEITLDGYQKGFKSMCNGITEKELSAVISSRWLELGAEGIGFLGIVSSPQGVRYAHVGPSDACIRKGEILNIDGGCIVDGYCADVFRMACIGEPKDKKEKRLIKHIIKAEREAIVVMKPGVRCGQVFNTAEKILKEAGYGHLLADTTIGHGIGLDIHELPTLSKDSKVEIQENMVFCVEPWTLDYSDWSMGRNFEDMVA